jgi:hypothetical protein
MLYLVFHIYGTLWNKISIQIVLIDSNHTNILILSEIKVNILLFGKKLKNFYIPLIRHFERFRIFCQEEIMINFRNTSRI